VFFVSPRPGPRDQPKKSVAHDWIVELRKRNYSVYEISMLSLHLIQNCMVYINTLMIQKLLAQPHWQGKFTPRDYAALTPLIWEHVNPYGRFDLDMNTRLALL
jgi:hypothetical protein